MATMTIDPDGGPGRRERAQAIILAGFILAVGVVAAVAIVNNTIESVNVGGASADVSTGPIDYRETMQSEATNAMGIVNELARSNALHWSDANSTYVNYTENLNFRIQNVIESKAAVEVEDLRVNSSFNNSWRFTKNQTTPFQEVVRRPVEVVYAIDSSGSMDDNDDSGLRYDAVKSMTKNLSRVDRVGVVDWDHDAGFRDGGIVMRFQNGSGRGQEKLNETVGSIKSSAESEIGGTYMGGGIREAVDLYREDGKSSHDNVVILLADGENTEGWMHVPRKYVHSSATGETLHEWGYNNGGTDLETDDLRSNAPGGTTPPNESLDERTVYQATKEANQSITVYTVLLEGTGNVDKPLMQEIANKTGGSYYETTNPDELNDIFNRIADDISDPTPLAREVDRYDRFQITIDEFTVDKNLTVRVKDETGSTLWQMNASNASGKKVVAVRDNSTVHNVWNWTDPDIGGTPFEIDVLDDTIGGADRNLSKDLFLSEANTTVVFDGGQGVNGTYDVWTDTGANVTNSPCGIAPCATQVNQTSGAIREANFTVTYESGDVTYRDNLSISALEEDIDTSTGSVGGGSSPSTSGDGESLTFDPIVHDFDTYWPMDENDSTPWWPQEHVFDAANNNHTAGRTPDAPDRETGCCGNDFPGVDGLSYNFSEEDYVEDRDAWNEIPIEEQFTISFWFRPSAVNGSDTGVLYDATRPGADFAISLQGETDGWNDQVVWEYEDENGRRVNVSAPVPQTDLSEPDSLNKWIHVAAVGGWNSSVHALHLADTDGDFTAGLDRNDNFGGKPMQEPLGSGTFNGSRLGYNTTPNSGAGAFAPQGFLGRMDDFRIYDERLGSAVLDREVYYETGFDDSGDPSKFQGWSTRNSAGKTNYSFNEDPQAAYTCCEPDSRIELDNNVNFDNNTGNDRLAGLNDVTLSLWVQKSDDGNPDPGLPDRPEWWDEEDLVVEYVDDSGGPTTWREFARVEDGELSAGESKLIQGPLPDDALHDDFSLRFRQRTGSGSGYDYWYIDNVEIYNTTVTDIDRGAIDSIYDDVNLTKDSDFRFRRFFHTEYKTYDDNVDVRNLELKNTQFSLDNGTIDLRVESNVTADPGPENWSDWITLSAGNSSYDVPVGTHAENLTVPNDELRLRVEARAPGPLDAPTFHGADLEAP